jgi:hypothetical protein
MGSLIPTLGGTIPSNGIRLKVVYQLEVAPKEPNIVEKALEDDHNDGKREWRVALTATAQKEGRGGDRKEASGGGLD